MCSFCNLENYVTNLTLQNNTFFGNEAALNGGALKLFGFNFSNIMNNQNIFEENLALVGKDLAGEAKILKITSNLSIQTQEDAENMKTIDNIDSVSGNYSDFLVLLFDELNDFLITENDQNIKITPSNETILKLLQNTEPIAGGIGNFSLYTYSSISPNDSYSLIVSYSNYNFTVNTTLILSLRFCVKGENLINVQCIPCGFGYYSLDINDICSLCPSNSFCPGRDLLIPLQGYWRFDENSSLIVKCSNAISCPDLTQLYLLNGNSSFVAQYNFSKQFQYVCGEGAYGNLCFRCKKNYGLSSSKACVSCQVNYSVVLLIVFNFFILVYQTTTAFETKDDISRSLMKILINHNNYLNILSVFQNKIYNQQLDSVLSLNQQISIIGTITDASIFDCLIQDFVNIEDVVMTRMAFFSFFPLIIILALVLIRYLFLIIPFFKTKINEKNKFSIFFACLILGIYTFYPKLVSNTFDMLKCITLDNSNREFLEVDPNIECWGETHKFYILRIFLPNLLIWCLGWPIAFGFALIIKRRVEERSLKQQKKTIIFGSSKPGTQITEEIKSSLTNSISLKKVKEMMRSQKVLLSDEEKDEIFQKSKIYRFLTMEYHFSTYAWDEFFFGTNLLLLAVALLSDNMDATIFSVILMVIFFAMLIVTIKMNPFRFAENNHVCTISYMALLCSFYSMANLIFLETDDQVKETLFYSLIFLANGIFYLFWFKYFLMAYLVRLKKMIMLVLKKKTNPTKKEKSIIEIKKKLKKKETKEQGFKNKLKQNPIEEEEVKKAIKKEPIEEEIKKAIKQDLILEEGKNTIKKEPNEEEVKKEIKKEPNPELVKKTKEGFVKKKTIKE